MIELKEKLDKLESKIDEVAKSNNDQNLILVKMDSMFERQQMILEEHQRRSLASEHRVELLEQNSEKLERTLLGHLAFVKGAIWVFGGLGTVAGLVASLLKFFQ